MNPRQRSLRHSFFVAVIILIMATVFLPVQAQDFEPAATNLISTFTYQGYLEQSGIPVTATCDFQFGLFDAVSAGTQIGSTLTRTNVSVVGGIFNVQLDFGLTAFAGDDRYAAISVRCPAGSGSYTPLTPRQAVTPAPYATYAARAPWSGILNIPAGFADGIDNDILGGLTCTNGQVPQYNGTAWVCAGVGGTGDITGVTAGTGLTGGGQSGAVTLNVDPTVVQSRVTQTCAAGSSIRVINQNGTVTCETDDTGAGGGFWSLTGNSGTNPASQFVGTTDNVALEFRVNNLRVFRLEPNATSPNIIGGFSGNSVTAGVFGATISGGGQSSLANSVNGNYGTVGGGYGNTASDSNATVGGGFSNSAANNATVGGGFDNNAALNATVGGGYSNDASVDSATVGGGYDNTASADSSTIAGGWLNVASADAAFVGGGYGNTASGGNAVVGGGLANTASGAQATVGGGYGNSATGNYATIGGGGRSDTNNAATGNRVTDNYGTIGGGANNQAGNNDADINNDQYGTVGGGQNNRAAGYGFVGGGQNNTVNGNAGTVSGGSSNSAGFYATVGGGFGNVATAEDSTIGGGSNNIASGNESTVGGGQGNSATAAYATISGGGRSVPDNDATGNRVTDNYGTVGGGGNNQAGDNAGTTDDNAYATVGGGYSNSASGFGSTVGGGDGNSAALRATVGGGFSNEASNDSATVGGGYDNTASGDSSTIAGGWLNIASGAAATVGGGYGNQATKDRSTIAGGSDNLINGAGEDATIGGGYDNTVSSDSGTIAGGWFNTVTGTAAFVGGGYGNTASGTDSMVVGGFNNTASGNYSFAAGTRAQADDFGAFVWGDGTDTNIFSPGGNTFSVRATNGIWLGTTSSPSIPAGRFINTSTGAYLTTGGAFTNASDVNSKENFADLDPQAVLETLMAIPVTTWNYIAEGDAVRRMGPMAQDFYAAYGLGDNDTTISTIDAQGVAFAAIQGLYQTVLEENTALRADNAAQQAQIDEQQARIERLEAVVMGGSSAGVSPVVILLLLGGGLAGVVLRRRTLRTA